MSKFVDETKSSHNHELFEVIYATSNNLFWAMIKRYSYENNKIKQFEQDFCGCVLEKKLFAFAVCR